LPILIGKERTTSLDDPKPGDAGFVGPLTG